MKESLVLSVFYPSTWKEKFFERICRKVFYKLGLYDDATKADLVKSWKYFRASILLVPDSPYTVYFYNAYLVTNEQKMFRGKNSTVVRLEHWKRSKKKKISKSRKRDISSYHQKYISPPLNVKKPRKVRTAYHFILLISSLMDRFGSRFTNRRTLTRNSNVYRLSW